MKILTGIVENSFLFALDEHDVPAITPKTRSVATSEAMRTYTEDDVDDTYGQFIIRDLEPVVGKVQDPTQLRRWGSP
jgi:hypothetical protein